MKWKLLMICTVELGRNGITTCIQNYCQYLRTEACQVDVLATDGLENSVKEELQSFGCKIHENSLRKESTMKYFQGLVKFLKHEKYDIVHVHGNSCTMAIELLAAVFAGCRVRIAHSHNTTCQHMRAHKLLRPFFEVACNGRFACGQAAGEWLFHNKKFFVVKNGINLDKYAYDKDVRDIMRKSMDVSEDEILLGHVGLFNYQKNHEFLIRMFETLVKSDSKYKLLCVGDGENKEEITKYVKEHGLKNAVIFTGTVSNVPDYLQAMDCFLLPSHFEGLPFVLVEAQAVGLPCVVSDKVSKESDISKTINFLPLDEEHWCSFINDMDDFSKRDNKEKLQSEGFDIKKNAESMMRMYQQLRN